MNNNNNSDSGIQGAFKTGTSTVCICPTTLAAYVYHSICVYSFPAQLGNAVGGITKTAGGLVGTAGKGVGDTINNTTGTKAVGDGLQGITGGIEDAGNSAAKGVENAGQGKK